MKCRICKEQVRFRDMVDSAHPLCLENSQGTLDPSGEHRQSDLKASAEAMILTTETAHDLPVSRRLGIVTAETVLGMNAFKDMFADMRGTFGGRSETLQKGLRDARDICLEELKLEAATLGADAVVGVDLDYNEIGATGSTMLMLVASGTAVKLETNNA